MPVSPGRRQPIIWILLIGPLGTNFNEILINNYKFSFRKMHLKMSSWKWRPFCLGPNVLTNLPPHENYHLTHWGRVTHICVSKLSIIGSDNGLSPDRRQAIIYTNAGILLIGTLGTNFNDVLIEIHTFSSKNIHFKMSSGKWRPFCPGLNVLNPYL